MSDEPDSVRYMRAHTLRQTIVMMSIERKHNLEDLTTNEIIARLLEIEATAAAGIARFDGRDAWGKIPPDQQVIIGAIALELVVAAHAAQFPNCEAIERAALAAQRLAGAYLQHNVIGTLALAEDTPPRIPSCLGRVCHVCGCSEHDACVTIRGDDTEGNCGWVEGATPDRCTACPPTDAAS